MHVLLLEVLSIRLLKCLHLTGDFSHCMSTHFHDKSLDLMTEKYMTTLCAGSILQRGVVNKVANLDHANSVSELELNISYESQ